MDFAARLDDAARYIASGLGLGVFDGSDLPQGVAWLQRSGIAHRVIWAPVEDALAEGWRTDTDDEQDITADFDQVMCLEDRAAEGMGSARVYGGSFLWPVTKDDKERWHLPLTIGEHEVTAVQVVTGREAVPRMWETDPGSPLFGRPKSYTLTIARGGGSWTGEVHASRLAYLPGSAAVPDQRLALDHLDIPTLDLYLAAIADLERGWSSTTSLLTRLSVWWMKLGKDGNTAASNGIDANTAAAQARASLMSRLETIRSSVSTRSLLPLGPLDEVGWSGPSVAGVRDLITAIMERCSAVEGIPLTILYGQAPGGLSTDDKGGRSAYNRILARLRRIILTPALQHVYDVRFGPGARRIVWPELDRPTAMEAAQISLTLAQRDETLIRIGAIVDAESRGRFEDGEELPLPVLDEVYAIVPGDQRQPEGEPVEGAPMAPGGNVAPDENVAAKALNGAQTLSLRETLAAVTAREIDPDAAILVLRASFPDIPEAEVQRMVALSAAWDLPEQEPAAPPPEAPADGEDFEGP